MSARLPLQSKAFKPQFQRKGAVFGDDDDDDEVHVQEERVVGIEDNKIKEAEPKKEQAPPTIQALPNADWRANAKHKKQLYLPAQAQQQQEASSSSAKPELLQQGASHFGLQVPKKTTETITTTTATTTTTTTTSVSTTATNEENMTAKTIEEQAVEAIIKESKGEVMDTDNQPDLVIPNETIAFRDDVQNRPDETSMEDYENIPVDQFGAALLRGLGWKEGEGIGRNRKNSPAPAPVAIKQREALLGLGAKPEQIDVKNERGRAKSRRAAYEYKDTSLFKKIAKKKLDEQEDKDRDYERRRKRRSRSRSRSRERRGSSSRSSSRYSGSRRSRSRERSSSSSNRHREHSSSSRRRSRSPVSRRRSRSPVSRKRSRSRDTY